jgi:ribosomal protein S18 acetylase RimI-like enzyme
MKLTIRDYQPHDFEAIVSLWEATGMGGAFRGDDREVIDRTIQIGGKLLILLDEKTGKLIGTSWMTLDGRRIYLHHFGISPEYQGKGYSKELLNASLAFARKTGLQLKLEVHKDNIIARDLYTRVGFQYLGDYDVYIIRNYKEL